ncbi:MAG: PEP-CTERM sorting domain-containing protein [Pirellulales bacterium]|nr:PEP-CTERM sorting domain-containing protein [Pirellulales bacterium]
MSFTIRLVVCLPALACALAIVDGPARADQFPNIDPNYSQEIYAGPNVAAGMAWTSSGHLLTRNGNVIREYNPTQNTTHQGNSVHGVIATYTITGLGTGVGMTNGLDGYIYAITNAGLQRINPSNWAAPAVTLPGSVAGQYGVTTLPDGRIAYTDSGTLSNVYIYDPVLLTNTLIHTSAALVDGMVAGPGGNIAITGQTNQTITILTNTGSVVNSFGTTHFPDGLAFSSTASTTTLYSNNNDGTVSRYVFGANFTGIPTISDIAWGSGAYGDLASVGPDCAFYVSQFENGSYHGATPGVGTNWNNGTNAEPSIVRIAAIDRNGLETCEFYTPYVTPEPATFGLMASGLVAFGWLAAKRRRRR